MLEENRILSSKQGRIPAKQIKKIEEPFAINDRLSMPETEYLQAETEKIIEETKKRVHEEEENAILEIQKNKENIYQKAYEDGKRMAVEEAKKEIEHEYQEIFEQANNVYQQANQKLLEIVQNEEKKINETMKENQKNIIELAVRIAEKIIYTEIQNKNINLEKKFQDLFMHIHYQTKKIVITIHPDMEKEIKKIESLAEDKRLEWLYDLHLSYGEFRVETDREFIDGTIISHLEEIRRKLKQA